MVKNLVHFNLQDWHLDEVLFCSNCTQWLWLWLTMNMEFLLIGRHKNVLKTKQLDKTVNKITRFFSNYIHSWMHNEPNYIFLQGKIVESAHGGWVTFERSNKDFELRVSQVWIWTSDFCIAGKWSSTYKLYSISQRNVEKIS